MAEPEQPTTEEKREAALDTAMGRPVTSEQEEHRERVKTMVDVPADPADPTAPRKRPEPPAMVPEPEVQAREKAAQDEAARLRWEIELRGGTIDSDGKVTWPHGQPAPTQEDPFPLTLDPVPFQPPSGPVAPDPAVRELAEDVLNGVISPDELASKMTGLMQRAVYQNLEAYHASQIAPFVHNTAEESVRAHLDQIKTADPEFWTTHGETYAKEIRSMNPQVRANKSVRDLVRWALRGRQAEETTVAPNRHITSHTLGARSGSESSAPELTPMQEAYIKQGIAHGGDKERVQRISERAAEIRQERLAREGRSGREREGSGY